MLKVYTAAVTSTSQAGRFDRFDVLKACRSAFLEQLSTLLRDSRLVSEAAINAVLDGTGRHFDAMLASQRTGSFHEEARGLTSSRITLVGDDDLELDIRFDNLCKRLAESTSVQLWKTHLRFVTLLGRPNLPKTQNPVGPEGIVAGLQSLFAAAGASSLDEKLDLLDRIEVLLREGLPVIYTRIDALLDGAGAEAAQPAIIGSGEAPRPATAAPAPAVSAVTGAAAQGVLSQLAGKLAKNGQPVAGHSLLSHAALDNLMFRLEQLERSHRNNTDFLTATSPKLESLIPGLFADASENVGPSMQPVRAHELGVPATTAEGQAIDAVGQFYSAVFSDPELPDTLKLLIAELQVITVRLALKDRTLFSRADHPLRLLIDRIGAVFIALPANADRQHPLCRKLSEIISRLKGGFGGNTDGIGVAADAVSELQAEQLREISSQAAAYMPLLHQIDRRDQAAGDIRRLLEAQDIGNLPPVLQGFFRQDWKRLLEKAWFEEGIDGPAWQSHARTLTRLLWTFRPKADSEERQALARELPQVLKSVKAGMEQLAMPAEAQAAILDACFELQTRAMRPAGSASASQAAPIPAPPYKGSRQMTQGRVEAGDLVLHTLDFPSLPSSELPKSLPAPGVWLSVPLEGIEHTLCLCQRSPTSGRSLLFSPDPRLALAIHPQLLELRLRDGSIRQLGEPPLFARLLSRALESVA
jgi:hypothetical protein